MLLRSILKTQQSVSNLVLQGRQFGSMRRPLGLVFLGPPGSGKGTYAGIIAPKFSLSPISTGDLLRDELARGSELGKQAAGFASSGKLVPDDIVNSMVAGRVENLESGLYSGLILDGYPRTLEQAKFLSSLPIDIVAVNIILKEEFIVQKILGRRVCPSCKAGYNTAYARDQSIGVDLPPMLPKHGDPDTCDCGCKLETRGDDTEAVLERRLKEYHEKTHPLIEYYTQRASLIDFNVQLGVRDMDRLENLIRDFLASCNQSRI